MKELKKKTKNTVNISTFWLLSRALTALFQSDLIMKVVTGQLQWLTAFW